MSTTNSTSISPPRQHSNPQNAKRQTIGEIALNLIRGGHGRLITRKEPAQALYGPNADVAASQSVMRQAIHHARNLLGDLPADRYQIATHFKLGWVWRPRR